MDYKFNLKRDPIDERDYKLTSLNLSEEIPTKCDLRAELSPIVNQGNSGTCQSCAIVAIDQYINKYAWVPSIPFEYYCLHDVANEDHNEDCGGTLRDTIKTVVNYGVCNSLVWPNSTSWRTKPSEEAYKDGLDGNDVLKTYYSTGNNKSQIKQALTNKNLVIVGIEVFTSFSEDTNFLKEGVFPMPKDNDESMGGHAVVVVGYDDEKEWFIIRNSWGVEVGDNGYFYLPYAVWDKIGWDGWTIIQ